MLSSRRVVSGPKASSIRRLRPRDPDLAAADSDHGSLVEGVAVMRNDVRHERNAALRRHVGQANESRVRHIVKVDQLPEVRVDGDQHPAQRFGKLQQRPIAPVSAESAGLQDIVPDAAK